MTVRPLVNNVESADEIITLQPCAKLKHTNLPQARNTNRNNFTQRIVQKYILWIMKQNTAVKMNCL